MKTHLLWLGLLLAPLALTACSSYRVAPLRFRTMQPADAFARAEASMQSHAGAVRDSDPRRGILRSQWLGGNELRGNYYQFIAQILTNPADESASVTVSMRVVRCNMLTKLSDDKARWCDERASLSDDEVVAFERFRVAFRDDVFRDQRPATKE